MQKDRLTNCNMCPRRCGVNRIEGKAGTCKAGANTKVALASVHMGEEPCISGTKGSGTVFFSYCNLKCVFCQNFDISQQGFGREVTIEELAGIFIAQQNKGVHNINLVSPTQYIVQIRQALLIAKQEGLNIPVIYNTNGYEGVEGLRLLKGLVDVYLPDLKYSENEIGERYSGVSDYFEKASQAVLEMYSQVGSPIFDDNEIIKRGLIIRHLILPGQLENSKKVLGWIRSNLPKDIYTSLMCQYTPMYKACDYPELKRRLYKREYEEIVDYFFEIGLENGFVQELSSAKKAYTPKFDLRGVL
ncbi:MAG: radical SAM protein [Deltaproteobacteria bacterium]